MLEIEVAITIRRPRQEVATVMFDPHHASAWMRGVHHGRTLVRGPLRRGDRLEQVTRRLGRRRTRVMEVVEYEAERRLLLAGVAPPGLHVHYVLEGIPEGTIARIRMLYPASKLRLLGPVLRASLRGRVVRDLRRLKTLMESGGLRMV